ncbi:hypothetical protein QFC19_003623 [Naganishia cerealis]|uniref:Uncharacterized protein n=1 Tax=Naganishia cerealis TaxID=610337 RepID=A0ACC2W141_9TREE|nr:hypothetical protein QFC19_003623 [Naganishia cerealis]
MRVMCGKILEDNGVRGRKFRPAKFGKIYAVASVVSIKVIKLAGAELAKQRRMSTQEFYDRETQKLTPETIAITREKLDLERQKLKQEDRRLEIMYINAVAKSAAGKRILEMEKEKMDMNDRAASGK